MDLQVFVDNINMPCAVISVRNREDGPESSVDGGSFKNGEFVIRIEKVNKLFLEYTGDKGRYYDGMIYTEYAPQEDSFEEYCRRAALLGKKVHTYVKSENGVSWADLMIIPLTSDDPEAGLCQMMFEPEPELDSELSTAPVSLETATAVIRNVITLMETENFELSVRKVLGDILKKAEARNGRIVLLDEEKHQAPVLCDILADGLDDKAMPGDGVIPYPVVKGWERMLGRRESAILTNDDEIERLGRFNPNLARMMRMNQVHSLLMLPLRRNEKILGFMYVINFNIDKTIEIKEMVEMMAFFLGAEIFNHQLMGRLEKLGNTDELTGLLNRHALKARMDKAVSLKEVVPFGLVTFDLNGLKEVNDMMGHDAGDAMIKHAGEVLTGIFGGNDVYRIGGDEFIAVVKGVTKAEFDDMISRVLDAERDDPDFSTAIGSFWADTDTEDFESVYKKADTIMYENKRSFYINHPEKNRRQS